VDADVLQVVLAQRGDAVDRGGAHVVEAGEQLVDRQRVELGGLGAVEALEVELGR